MKLGFYYKAILVTFLDKLMDEAYDNYKDKDGFLYIIYSSNESLG